MSAYGSGKFSFTQAIQGAAAGFMAGGPIGAAVGGVAAGLQAQPTAPRVGQRIRGGNRGAGGRNTASQLIMGALPSFTLPTSFGGLFTTAAASSSAAIPAGGAVALAGPIGMGVVRTVTGLIRGVMTLTGFVTRKNAVRLAKQLGIAGAGAALAVTGVEMAEMVMQETSRGRKRTGISAGALSTTGKTIRKINSIACKLKDLNRISVRTVKKCA